MLVLRREDVAAGSHWGEPSGFFSFMLDIYFVCNLAIPPRGSLLERNGNTCGRLHSVTHKADVGKRSVRPPTAVGWFSSPRKARETVLQLKDTLV